MSKGNRTTGPRPLCTSPFCNADDARYYLQAKGFKSAEDVRETVNWLGAGAKESENKND